MKLMTGSFLSEKVEIGTWIVARHSYLDFGLKGASKIPEFEMIASFPQYPCQDFLKFIPEGGNTSAECKGRLI